MFFYHCARCAALDVCPPGNSHAAGCLVDNGRLIAGCNTFSVVCKPRSIIWPALSWHTSEIIVAQGTMRACIRRAKLWKYWQQLPACTWLQGRAVPRTASRLTSCGGKRLLDHQANFVSSCPPCPQACFHGPCPRSTKEALQRSRGGISLVIEFYVTHMLHKGIQKNHHTGILAKLHASHAKEVGQALVYWIILLT